MIAGPSYESLEVTQAYKPISVHVKGSIHEFFKFFERPLFVNLCLDEFGEEACSYYLRASLVPRFVSLRRILCLDQFFEQTFAAHPVLLHEHRQPHGQRLQRKIGASVLQLKYQLLIVNEPSLVFLQCPDVLIDISDRGTSEGYRENFEKFLWRNITIVVGVFRLELGFKGVVDVWSGGNKI